MAKHPVIFGIALLALALTIVACGESATSTPTVGVSPTEEPTQPGEETPTIEPTEDNGEGTPTTEPTEPGNGTPTEEPTEEPTDMPSNPGEGVSVQPARADWNTEYVLEAIYSDLLEELGYEVQEFRELAPSFFYPAVGLGDVDFWPNGWFPLHDQYREDFESGASIAGIVAEAGALEGYLVDAAGAEEFGITSLEDFTRDEVKEAYDSDGNGNADLYACPGGWGCHDVIGYHLDTFELRDHVDENTAEWAPMMAEAIARYQNGEHIFFYTWTPNWTVNRLVPGEDVVWIEVPSPEYPGEIDPATLSIAGVQGCVKDPCLMGFPGNDISVVANNGFLEENPAAAALFETVSIPLEFIFEQNNLMNEGEDSQEDIERHAAEWIEENRDQVDQWLEQARTAASSG